MQILSNEIHIWTISLSDSQKEEKLTPLLNPDEINRANRFHFSIHRRRFIISHCMLRIILGHYLKMPPQEILFSYTSNKKPYISSFNPSDLKFNISHSDEVAVYAFTIKHNIGIDIEKIQDGYNHAVSERFFSADENHDLLKLPLEKRASTFYRIWAHKEALVKATGKGLTLPLSRFSISILKDYQNVPLLDQSWSLISLTIHPDYQAAVATDQPVKTISYWKYYDQEFILDKVSQI